MTIVESETATEEVYRTVQIEAQLLESVDEWVGSPEAADEWIAEAVEQYLSKGIDPRPGLGPGEYREWVMNEAIRERLGTVRGPESGPSAGD